jgi:RNA polymerase sigma factor (sigma-70 family)
VSAEQHRSRLSQFLAEEWHRLVLSVRSWLADTAERDAEDVVQDVAVRLLEYTGLSDPIQDLSAYVYRALRNRVVDLYRRRKPAGGQPLPGPLPEELPDERAAAPEAREELRQGLFTAIDRLPEAQRAVFLATELEGSSYRELSEKWGVPIGTLLARKHRAVKALRAALAHLQPEYLGGGT